MSTNNKEDNLQFDSFEQFFDHDQENLIYWVESAKYDFTEQIVARIKELEMTKSQLAERLHAKPSFITRVLSGSNNFELQTMVKIARALDCKLVCSLEKPSVLLDFVPIFQDNFYFQYTAPPSFSEGLYCEDKYNEVSKSQIVDSFSFNHQTPHEPLPAFA